MGERYGFRCQECGYENMVSAGYSQGMFASTVTIVCKDCQDLQDVLTFKRDWNTGVGKAYEPSCEQSETHEVALWREENPCPKCKGLMKRTGKLSLWD